MTRIVPWNQIANAVGSLDLVGAMEEAFVALSAGRANVPPVGELLFPDRNGEAHIKYGYLQDDDVFVIKVATGFYDNPAAGLPSTSGLVLVFDRFTGVPRAVLLDDGLLTNLRTAAAGAVAAKHLAKPDITHMAVLGGGVQALLQMDLIRKVTTCRSVFVWARREAAARGLANQLEALGFTVAVAGSVAEAAQAADIIVTTTAATAPLLRVEDVKPGTHITAMGSDTPDKRELDGGLLAAADVVAADSRAQCVERGEIHHAMADGLLSADRVVELGEIIAGTRPGRRHSSDLTIADLTGVAVQDIAIAKAVLAKLGD